MNMNNTNRWTTFEYNEQPSSCAQCKARFDKDGLLQAELKLMAVKYGASAAEAELNERYAEQHIQHINEHVGR